MREDAVEATVAEEPAVMNDPTAQGTRASEAVLLLAFWLASAAAGAGLGLPPLSGPPFAAISHIAVHNLPRVPEMLLHPIGAETTAEVCKGYEPDRERVLVEALLAGGLNNRLVRVGVASTPYSRMALIKLQMMSRNGGVWSLAALEQDVMTCLDSVFWLEPDVEHVDIWAVVPETLAEDREKHLPVFSASVSRDRYAQCGGTDTSPAQRLSRLGHIRFSPLLLTYCPEILTVQGWSNLPRGAIIDPPQSSQQYEYSHLEVPARKNGRAERAPVKVVVRLPEDHPRVALTIDDGPNPLVTPLLLDVLAQLKVKATFFLVGSQAEYFPELAARIAAEGHEIANHTYSHARLPDVERRWACAEIKAAERVLWRITGERTTLFRPPGGRATADTLHLTEALGYTTVLWTHNSCDWQYSDPAKIVAAATSHQRPGSIILMHQDGLASCHALPAIVESYRRAGLRFVTLSEGLGPSDVRRMRPSDILPLLSKSHLWVE